MKVALINAPVSRLSPHSRLAPPLGLAYVGSALLAAGHEVSAIDFNVSGLNLRRVDRLMEVERPGVVGISAQTETYPNALLIARRVKELSPGTQVVLGGPHPTLLPEAALAEPVVDFVVLGEGEATMCELVHRLETGVADFEAIAGLGYRNPDPRLTGRRPPLDPEAVPHPARHLFPLEFYQDRWNVLTARGSCPFRCPFCSASALWEGRRRARRPEHVLQEVRELCEECGATYIFFADDIFTLDHRWVRELLGLLRGFEHPVEWGCATRVDMVDATLLAEMAQAGCRAIQFGVESGAEAILHSVKGIRKDQALQAVKAAREVGIDVACSFMVPFPEDTPATIRETKEFMRALKDAGSKILLAYTTPFPGTDFFWRAPELGIRILTDRWDEYDAKHNVLATRHLTPEDIDQLVREMVDDLGLTRSVG